MNDAQNSIQLLPKCQWCGDRHEEKCPMIKSIEYSEISPALIKRIEFFSPNDVLYTLPPSREF